MTWDQRDGADASGTPGGGGRPDGADAPGVDGTPGAGSTSSAGDTPSGSGTPGSGGAPEGFGPPPPPAPPAWLPRQPAAPPGIPSGYPSGYAPGFPAGPPAPPAPPPAPANALRAVAVGLLNLSGLGIGYALTRRWLATAACLVATGVLLFVALPATADGVSGVVVVAYAVFLVLAAAHGAYRGLRTPLSWPPRTPVAIVLGLVLLAAPVGGVVYYDGARDEATQKMLLDRLDTADQLVQAAKSKPFDEARTDYTTALAAYRDLSDHHGGSRAAKRVPDRLTTYYTAVGTPYEQKRYCDAIEPLKYLRTVPEHFDRKALGTLTGWPDDRLATSLYACGTADLADASGAEAKDGYLSDLLSTYPKSPQAAKVEPAFKSTIDAAARDLNGGDPCAATDKVRALGVRAGNLKGGDAGVAAAFDKDARRADTYVQSGSYTCAVHEYKGGDFSSALDKIRDFVKKYPRDKNTAYAKKLAIAAEVAVTVPAAGKRMPTEDSGGSISVTVSNDSPDQVEVLFTGPVTGSFTLKGCGACKTYSSQASAQTSACNNSGRNYPKKTLNLPVGTTYFLHKSTSSGDSATPGSDTVKLRSGYIYTECAYVVRDSALSF
ncbi:hypothetical protein [Streptomyces sp. NPDC088910]|uniref:hypothetical protein n=1 Tax=Streptomyces sp. NPDC088910 TaxID=3365911 RepID=UPI0037F2ADF8